MSYAAQSVIWLAAGAALGLPIRMLLKLASRDRSHR